MERHGEVHQRTLSSTKPRNSQSGSGESWSRSSSLRVAWQPASTSTTQQRASLITLGARPSLSSRLSPVPPHHPSLACLINSISSFFSPVSLRITTYTALKSSAILLTSSILDTRHLTTSIPFATFDYDKPSIAPAAHAHTHLPSHPSSTGLGQDRTAA
jgi:hypothetical protein